MFRKTLIGIISILPICNLFAASFDCTKAENSIEKTICSDKNLSELDDKMSVQFKNTKGIAHNPQLLIQEQRKWIAERNKCADATCLSKSYAFRLAQLNSAKREKNANCPITEKNLLGAWIHNEDGDFEEMAFDVYENKHTFVSWLHHRPEMTGTWNLQDCKLHITNLNDPTFSFDYIVKRYDRGNLYLQEIDGNKVSVYTKVKQ